MIVIVYFRSVRLLDTAYLKDTQLSMCHTRLTETLQSFHKQIHSDQTDGLKSEEHNSASKNYYDRHFFFTGTSQIKIRCGHLAVDQDSVLEDFSLQCFFE